MHATEDMRLTILELTSEDDYGSWELWWKCRESVDPLRMSEVKDNFVEAIRTLIVQGQIQSKGREPSGRTVPKLFDVNRLSEEIAMADAPDPNSFYWFGRAV